MTKSRSKLLVLLTLASLCLAGVLGFWFFKQKHNHAQFVHINRDGQPMLGKKKAKIHLVVFEDLKCTNCKIYNNTLFPKIKEKYIDTDKANYTFINLAFIPGSLPAANAAQCLYHQNKKFFFPFVEYIFQHQPDETEDWATTATLLQFAKAAVPNANLDSLSSCMIEARYNSVIEKNLQIATDAMDGKIATPMLFVNGRRVENLSFSELNRMISHAHRDK